MQLSEGGLTNPVRGNFRLRWNLGQKKEHFFNPAFIKDHTGHLRTEKKKKENQKCFILAQLNRDIEQTFKMCCICQKNKPSQAKEPLLVAQEKLFPWSNIG